MKRVIGTEFLQSDRAEGGRHLWGPEGNLLGHVVKKSARGWSAWPANGRSSRTAASLEDAARWLAAQAEEAVTP